MGYYRHLSLHKGTNQLLEGPECQTDLCKITTTLWSRSLRLKSSKLQLHLIYAWSWSNQSSQGPRSSDLGFLFKSTASTTHRKNGRKKERKKETNKLRRKHPYYLPFNYPVMSSGFDCAHFGCLNVSFAFTCEYDSFPALFIAPAEYHLATA